MDTVFSAFVQTQGNAKTLSASVYSNFFQCRLEQEVLAEFAHIKTSVR